MGILQGDKKNVVQPFHPNLTGNVTPETKQAIDYLFDRIGKSAIHISDVAEVAKAAAKPGDIGPEASKQLTIAGGHPLNLEGLLGTLAQPQKASASQVSALPGPQDPLRQNGQIVYFNHRLYWFDGSTDPGVWRALGSTIILDTHANRLLNYPAADFQFSAFFETDRTVLYISDGTNWIYAAGTYRAIVSSLPSDLGTSDVNFEFYSTDLGRGVYWSGTVWIEAPQSLRVGKDARRINVAANEGMISGGGSSPDSIDICFGDNSVNYGIIFGTPVAGVFANRFAILSSGHIFGLQGATTVFQISNSGVFFPQNTGSGIYSGNGSPEGAVVAEVGSTYLRRDGSTDSAIYQKTSGSGNTGWVAVRDSTLLRFGTGSPEGVVTAGVGSLFQQTDASSASSLWNKESGSGNTGWVIMDSASTVKDVDHGGTGLAGGYTKGDLIVAQSASLLDNLPVGADGTVLTADSAQTLGVKWDTPSSGETNSYLEDHSGGLSCGTTYAATGIAVTLNQDGYWLIIGTFDADVNLAGGLLEGALSLNGGVTFQTGVATLFAGSTGGFDRASICRPWVYQNTGGATPVAELYARVGSTGGGGGGNIHGTNSTIVAVFLHS